MSRITPELSQRERPVTHAAPRSHILRFSDWLERQEGRGDTVGKLANFVKSDSCWPRSSSEYVVFRNHVRIEHSNVPIAEIMALDEAWEEYLAALRLRARRA